MQKKLRIILLIVLLLVVLLGFLISFLTSLTFWPSLLIGLGAFLLVAVIGFLLWAYHPMGPEPAARESLTAPEGVQVGQEKWGFFITPQGDVRQEKSPLGILFYPGGRVHHLSYGPVLLRLARLGFPVYLVRMPCYMAVFDYQRAARVMAAHPEVGGWVIGGHSLGGAMAAHYVIRRPQRVRGLFLWGAYPSERDDLSGLDLPVQMICADCDGITTRAKVERVRAQLPPDARWKMIEGGNHAQFGAYGAERLDTAAALSPEAQWDCVAREMEAFMMAARDGV